MIAKLRIIVFLQEPGLVQGGHRALKVLEKMLIFPGPGKSLRME